MASSTKISPKQYPKRSGTSGIRGQWYETKLLSLIYFRAIHNDDIEDFHLATNVDGIGSFDDICFKAKFRGVDKPVVVFLQAKHKEKGNSVFTLSKTDLLDYFNSYMDIRVKFKPNNTDVLFDGERNETDCFFVIYTTAKGDKTNKTYTGNSADDLNALLKTGDPASQPSLEDKDVEHLCKIVIEEQMTALARQMAKCIFNEYNDIQMLMQDEVVQMYHVILRQKVFDISDIKPERYRVASLRNDFFDINEESLRLFKDELCTEILNRRSRDSCSQFRTLLNSLALLRQATDTETLYREVGSRFIYKNGKFVSLDKNSPDSYKLFLDKINESQESIRKTVEMAVKECLPSTTFKVPAAFGNQDLTIRGSGLKIDRKLEDLTFKIVRFIENSELSNVVVIDNSFGKGFLELSGGIASAVGNLLVLDEASDSKKELMRINDDYESLGNLSKQLYRNLKKKVDNLNEYKFYVKARIFPKLSFATDECNKNVVSDFLNSLVFFTTQQNEKDVEETLIFEIINGQGADVEDLEVTADAIFLKFHDEVQKWSTNPEEIKGTYLEKEGSLYKNAVNAARQPLTSVINMIQGIKNKHYSFREEALNTIKFDDLRPGTVIVTENSTLTVAKLSKHLTNTVVLDFQFILNLSATYHKALREELVNTKTVKKLIVVFTKAESIDTSTSRKVAYIANAMKDKKVIIITDRNSVENAKKYLTPIVTNVIEDETELIDLTEESQKSILENTKVIFQGDEVTLAEILIKDTMKYVRGDVFNKIMQSNKNVIGKPVSDSNYKPNLYIPRSVRPFSKKPVNPSSSQTPDDGRKQIQTLDAPDEDVVMIFGDPGMGKSTLLTHLSLATKRNWPEIGWIVRINLLEHTKQFRDWKYKKTNIDCLESLKFLCQAALSEESGKTKDLNIILKESVDGTVYLDGCNGNEWTIFELKMFLNFYSYRQLIILLDGFDEIYPNYMNEVVELINSMKKFSRTHKMWITSRSYEKIYTTLENLQLGILFQIEPMDLYEQEFYLSTFWDDKEILKDLKDNHFKNIYDCVTYVVQSSTLYVMVAKKKVPRSSSEESYQEDIPFFFVGLSLIKYLKINLKSGPPSIMNFLKEYFNERTYKDPTQIFENEYVTTPLHLDIVADYFYHKIKETSFIRNKKGQYWNYKIYDIYNYYVESKLRIRLEEKTKNDMSKPENDSTFERAYAECMEKHKKLAAYGLYYRSRSKLFDDDELTLITYILNELKEGEERTGIICNVVNDMPLFVHSTFEEYLALEYICHAMKTKGYQKQMWDFLINDMFLGNINILISLDAKMKTDDTLFSVFNMNKITIFQLLLEQGKNSRSNRGGIQSAFTEAIRNNLLNLVRFFLFQTLNAALKQSNLMDFIDIVKETNMLLLAVKMENESVVANIISHVKRVDKTKLSVLFENIELDENLAELNTDEILHKLHRYLWTRMKIVPDYYNSIYTELRSQTVFI